MILAGDIGGTKCNLALVEKREDGISCAAQARLSQPGFLAVR